jgi:indole-3-glycerol phosphate synthase
MRPGTILDRILASKRQRLAAVRPAIPEVELASWAASGPRVRDLAAALRAPGRRPRVIAEVKRASPSAGAIRPDADPASIALEYLAAGAAAVSVLTEEDFFDGSLAHLAAVRARMTVPVLRKDFLFDPWQLAEARAAGADAVLLIVAMLDDDLLARLLARAHQLGMGALVEVHDEEEAARATDAGARIIGVNHRNLATLEMDMDLFARIRPRLGDGIVAVAESGIKTPADVRRLAEAGADAILVGESLMRQTSPGAALRELMST